MVEDSRSMDQKWTVSVASRNTCWNNAGMLLISLLPFHCRSFYPLSPANTNESLVDYTHREHFDLPLTPDILVVPSRLAHFIKVLWKEWWFGWLGGG